MLWHKRIELKLDTIIKTLEDSMPITVKDLEKVVGELVSWLDETFTALDDARNALAAELAKDVVEKTEMAALHDTMTAKIAELNIKIHASRM